MTFICYRLRAKRLTLQFSAKAMVEVGRCAVHHVRHTCNAAALRMVPYNQKPGGRDAESSRTQTFVLSQFESPGSGNFHSRLS